MLDPKVSVYPYNYSVAQEFYPLMKSEETLRSQMKSDDNSIDYASFGYTRSEYKKSETQAEQVTDATSLPDLLNDADSGIIHQAIRCVVSEKLFRITQQELDFYKEQHIPLPHLHPDERYSARLSRRPARNIYLRTCDKT